MTNTRSQNEQNTGNEPSDETSPQNAQNEDEQRQRNNEGTASFIPTTSALRPPTNAPATPQTSLTQLGRRRRRSDADGSDTEPIRSRRKRPRMRDLPEYKGESIEEAQAFIAGAERRFRQDAGYTLPTDEDKIDFYVLAFDTKPERIWNAYEKERKRKRQQQGDITWDEFTAWLLDTIRDPVSRQLEAWNAYEEICQGASETVDDFARRLAVLEEAVGAEDDKVNASKLYAKLTPYLRTEVLRLGFPPTTRQGMLTLVRRIENADRMTSDPTPFSRQGIDTAPPGSGRHGQGIWCKNCKQSGRHMTRYCPQSRCFLCQGMGHFARDCPNEARPQGQRQIEG